MQILNAQPLSNADLEELGLQWHTDTDDTPYISNAIIEISEQEAQNFYDAANTLYDMYIEAGQYVIDHNLFFELGIPFNLVETIKRSWEDEVHWHLYGRFDFAGGLDDNPIKLLEFNADTPTMLYESSIIQWALLKKNGFDASLQFNSLYEALGDNFKRIITLGDDISRFEDIYEGWKILFSSIAGSIEEERTVKLLEIIAKEAGFETNFCYAHEALLDEHNGLSFNGENYEFWFKLIPWESIAIDEPELAQLITAMIVNKNTIFLNPAYTLLFQSKRMLKILWDLFPNHPLLLETSYEPLKKKQVKKHAFGREGESVSILDAQGNLLHKQNGNYENYPEIYQEFALQNSCDGKFYQPNVFYAYEACALGFRKGGEILDNMSKFVAHKIK
ncbi:glutathionylspermidine synthase family protein [Helicobacter sp. MIT 11-5569]|uniref:glutathionylspermidine synthase family protein n=1 Tax=Helicobacter sp. MIT 11-5569 TaxID=1548151 RepID=UPI0010FF3086|nr:glutathionylspermidine synthase family protein [Helicobacter sp. MIT 11-5569]TLD85137.1 glutathionylspermidine synthase family protein [Helicobacter sp. MIT 11-5569]